MAKSSRHEFLPLLLFLWAIFSALAGRCGSPWQFAAIRLPGGARFGSNKILRSAIIQEREDLTPAEGEQELEGGTDADAESIEVRRQRTQRFLLEAAAGTCRGQCGSNAARSAVLELVEAMEALNPTTAPAENNLLEGEWRLVFASEDVTRSSPFFWAWRRLLAAVPDPLPLTRGVFGTELLSDSIFAVTDGIPFKSIGEATQSLQAGVLVNKVQVRVFGAGETMMTTTCSYRPSGISTDGGLLDLHVEDTRAVGSSIPVADAVVFPSADLLGDSASVRMRISYLDERLRISRNVADAQVFVYCRVS